MMHSAQEGIMITKMTRAMRMVLGEFVAATVTIQSALNVLKQLSRTEAPVS